MKRDLNPGDVRFALFFADSELRIPVISTLRYVGCDGDRLWFDQINDDSESRIFFPRNGIEEVIVDASRLLEKLKQCFEGQLGKC